MWYPQILPSWLSAVFPGVVIRGSKDEKTVHLTFDDGPIPEVTPWVLDLLGEYNQKATFFCVGDNVRKYPEIFNRIRSEGHAVGNHSMFHGHGWRIDSESYCKDVEEADVWIQSRLFRPPYGKLNPEQFRVLKNKYAVVMWSYLSKDYEADFSAERCIREVEKTSKSGCILVFHDNIKTDKNLRDVLPGILEFYSSQGIRSEPLDY